MFSFFILSSVTKLQVTLLMADIRYYSKLPLLLICYNMDGDWLRRLYASLYLMAIVDRVTACLENQGVREFDSCQGNVRDFTKSRGNVREKNLVREKLLLKLFIESCIFASMQVFRSSLFCVKCCFRSCTVAFLPPPLTVTLVQAWYE